MVREAFRHPVARQVSASFVPATSCHHVQGMSESFPLVWVWFSWLLASCPLELGGGPLRCHPSRALVRHQDPTDRLAGLVFLPPLALVASLHPQGGAGQRPQ
jgi:hypothetical protein